MPFTGTYTVTKLTTGLNRFRVRDTSSYTSEPKNTFTTRKVYLSYADGSYEESNGEDWFSFGFSAYPSDYIDFDFLTQDEALAIRIDWVTSNPQTGSVYTAVSVNEFIDYAFQFLFQKFYQMSGNRSLKDNANFWETLDMFMELIDASEICVNNSDQYSAQQCILQLQYIMANPNLFY